MNLQEQFEIELKALGKQGMWPLISHSWAKYALEEAIKKVGAK